MLPSSCVAVKGNAAGLWDEREVDKNDRQQGQDEEVESFSVVLQRREQSVASFEEVIQ